MQQLAAELHKIEVPFINKRNFRTQQPAYKNIHLVYAWFAEFCSEHSLLNEFGLCNFAGKNSPSLLKRVEVETSEGCDRLHIWLHALGRALDATEPTEEKKNLFSTNRSLFEAQNVFVLVLNEEALAKVAPSRTQWSQLLKRLQQIRQNLPSVVLCVKCNESSHNETFISSFSATCKKSNLPLVVQHKALETSVSVFEFFFQESCKRQQIIIKSISQEKITLNPACESNEASTLPSHSAADASFQINTSHDAIRDSLGISAVKTVEEKKQEFFQRLSSNFQSSTSNDDSSSATVFLSASAAKSSKTQTEETSEVKSAVQQKEAITHFFQNLMKKTKNSK